MRRLIYGIGFWVFTAGGQLAFAGEPALKEPGPNRADELVAPEYSLEKAVQFLDAASVHWQQQRKCMTCHTNYAYLYARPVISATSGIVVSSPAHQQVRQFAEQLVDDRWTKQGPRWDAEVVATAAALAFNDAATTGRLHATTRRALDRMWTLQRADGGWTWLKCGWPPMESDDHYGVTLAAVAVGVAPENYAETEPARTGLAGLRKYLSNHPPPTLHHQAMVLWAASYLGGLMSEAESQACIKKLLALQNEDGGWVLATLGDWQRADGTPQDLQTSDGYATGFVIYTLRRAGVPAESDAIHRGVAWLKANQRQSGRWFTRSLNKDSKHFISHAGTAMAVMALSSCNAL